MPASRLQESVALLRALNEARRNRAAGAAELLEGYVEEHDEKCGYSRPVRIEPAYQPGDRVRSGNWKRGAVG